MNRKCVCVAAVCLTLAIAGWAGAQQGVLFEYWQNIGGGTVISDLTSNPLFPDGPTSSEVRGEFMSPVDWADNTGTRARGYLTPPETGDYTFWVAGDDACQLWLSTDADPANASMIAQVTGWTGAQDWYNGSGAGGTEQQSAPIALEAGQMYYIEGLMKEGGGGDSLGVAWAGPGIGEAPTVIAGTYLTAFVRLQARSPNPADGAVDVTNPLLTWVASDTAVSHDIYFGTTPELTAADFKMNMPSPMYYHLEPLVPGTTYYWRIDEVDAAGTKITGKVWSFTVMPLEANTPNPPDGIAFAPLSLTLSWKAGQGVTNHDVYVGTDQAAVAAGDASVLAATVAETQYQVAGLEPETTYYWRVDEVDGVAGKIAGAVWSFSTLPLVEPIDEPNLVGWWTFETEPANTLTVLDMTGNGRYGTLIGGGIAVVDDADMGGVLSLPGGNGKYVSIGAVGISGNDPTTIACWAKADNTSIPDWTLVFGFTTTGGGNGSHFDIDSLGGPGGVGAHVWGWEETMFTDQEALEWHHYAMTYDGTTILYYGDGVAMDSDPAKSNVMDLAIRGDNVHIGKRITQESSFPGKVDDCRIYNRVLSAEEIAAFGTPALKDITGAGDAVQGVPNDGDWPGAETPALAIDNNVNTKFLHFKGETQPTGIQITPAAGPTLVTGMTLTTANDAVERDPVKFEIYGSNDSIDGPWTLIASGDVVDFAGTTAWPRFTMNATPITFANETVYTHYQVLFPAVRNPAAANSMQIAEIELLGVAAPAPVPPVTVTNMLPNGGFEDGVIAPYGTYGTVTATVVMDCEGADVAEGPIEGAYCLHLVVPAAGANSWDIGMTNGSFTLQAGKKYTFSCFMKTKSGTLQVRMKPERGADPWEGFNELVADVTDTWQEFSTTTPVMTADVTPASPTFHIGFAAGDFWIDGVRLYEGDYVAP